MSRYDDVFALAVRPEGTSNADARSVLNIPQNSVGRVLWKLKDRGRVFATGTTPERYFADAQRAAAYTPPASQVKAKLAHNGKNWRSRALKLDGAQPESMSEGVKRTVAQTCLDHRFTVNELPPGYVSQLDSNDARPSIKAVVG